MCIRDSLYLIPDTGYGGGWPILAWELQDPIKPPGTPEETAYAEAAAAFEQAKTEAQHKLKEGFRKYRETSYSEVGWASLTKVYNDAVKSLNALELCEFSQLQGKTPEEITAYGKEEIAKLSSLAEAALQEMDTVPTKQKEEAFEKQKEDALK